MATLKQVASTDKLTIEEKYKQPETVKQSHTLLLFTNHLPRVGSTDNGTWRRLIVVPFNAVIQPGSSVQNYGEMLAKECGSAILAWGIEGAVNFVRNGFKLDIPDAVAEATEEYQQREELSYHVELKKQLAADLELLTSLEAGAGPRVQHLDGMPHTSIVRDVVGDLAAEIADLKTEISELEAEMRDDANSALVRVKQQIIAFCIRHGKVHDGKSYWTNKHAGTHSDAGR